MSYGDAGSSSNSKARVLPTPSNLRFQRRTSERAFYEGSLREGGMEYPGSGTSPWASSPDASRTSFGDVSRTDAPGPASPQQHERGASSNAQPQNGQQQHDHDQSYQPQAGSWSPEQQHQWQEHQRQQQQQQQAPQRAPGEEGRRPQSARYHGVPPQQRQHMPQYKLQAKITGMERSQKKDLIIRFDVYVSTERVRRSSMRCLRSIRPIYPNSEPPSSAISDVRTLNFRNSPHI